MKQLFFILIIILCITSSCSDKTTEEVIPIKTKDFCESIHNRDSTTLSKELLSIADSMKTKTGVYVLEDGDG